MHDSTGDVAMQQGTAQDPQVRPCRSSQGTMSINSSTGNTGLQEPQHMGAWDGTATALLPCQCA